MAFDNIIQADVIEVEKNIRLRKTHKDEWKVAVEWYQNGKVMYYSIGVKDKKYTIEDITRMYNYLQNIGELYFIEIYEDRWIPIGDVTLSNKMLPITIGDESYWGVGIGKKVISKLLERAKLIGMKKISVSEIYHYNERSRNLFKSFGFVKTGDTEKGESYELNL